MSDLIAYAGEPGAFAEDALLAYFGSDARSLGVSSFGEVRAALLDGRAAHGVLPIENLINGTVRESLDLLRDGALEIVGEVVGNPRERVDGGHVEPHGRRQEP